MLQVGLATGALCLRPYHVENAGSRPITEAKQRRAWLVLGWVTAWEYRVLLTFLWHGVTLILKIHVIARGFQNFFRRGPKN